MSGSVVVPVEPTDEMLLAAHEATAVGCCLLHSRETKDIWTAMLAAAPAPSSLAGGEVERAKSWLEKQGVQTLHAEHPAVLINGLLRHIAALSPEAPAREGGWIEAAKRPDTTGDLWLAVDAAGKLFPGVFVNHRIPTEAALVQRIMLPGRDALTPRHEAPASEGDAS